MPLESTKPSQSRQTKSSNISALPDNTNTSPSWKSPRSNTLLRVWPTHCKSISTITTSRPTDASTWPSSKQSLANQSNPRDQLLSLKLSQSKRRLHPPLLNHLPKAQLQILSTSLAQSKSSSNPWLRLLLSNMRSQPVSLSLRCTVNQQPTLLSRQLSRQIPSVCRRTPSLWLRPLLNFNHNSQVLDLVVMALNPSSKCSHNRPASPQILSNPLCSSLSRVRHLNNSNRNKRSCHKIHSPCNSSSKMLLLCNSNNHKCSHHHNQFSRKPLTPSVSQ